MPTKKEQILASAVVDMAKDKAEQQQFTPEQVSNAINQKVMEQLIAPQAPPPEPDPRYAEREAQREELYQKLLNAPQTPSAGQELFSGLIHGLSGLGFLAGGQAGSAGVDRSRQLWQQREKNMQDEVNRKNQLNYNLLGVEDRRLAKMDANYGNQLKAYSKGAGKGVDLPALAKSNAALRNAETNEGSLGVKKGTLAEKERHDGVMEGIGANKPSQIPPFQATLSREDAKSYAKERAAVTKVDSELENVENAWQSLNRYQGSLGPVATAGGLRAKVDPELQHLDSMFRKVSLASLQRIFQGMARSIDSDVERAAFESTQPSIANYKANNAAILLGMKSLAMKYRVDMAAKAEWLKTHPDLNQYVSPLDNLKALVDTDGTVQLISRDQVGEAVKQGFRTPDDYVTQHWDESAQKDVIRQPEKTFEPPANSFPNQGRTPEEERRYQELLNKAKVQ